MASAINRHDVRSMVDAGRAQLVDVLPARQYENEHLPKAISIPLSELSAQRAHQLEIDQPVIVYCFDYQ
jgi:rhodanese-related sulfurtransferase